MNNLDRLYPADLPWPKLVWVLQPGDQVQAPDGSRYVVQKVTILPLNQPPIVELRRLHAGSET